MNAPHRRALLAGSAGLIAGLGLRPAAAQDLVEGPENWATMNRAQRDAAYNNNAAVPEGNGIIDRFNADSVPIRKRAAKTIDLAYGPKPRNRIDLFPGDSAGAPCLVFIHGGYWQSRSRESFACLMDGIRATGMAAALPSYTLAPDANLREILDEIIAALEWLTREGGKHGVAGPLIVSGWSAGGHLAARVLGHDAVRAGLAISGIFELGPLRDTYVDEKLKLTDEQVESLSPLRGPAIEKPLALAYGTAELSTFVENARTFHAYRSALHLPGALIPVPKANHFTVLEALRSKDGPIAQAAVDLAAAL